ncbi:hypothetical protein [Selenomonas sp. KH1T6]|nr:hypothetical protein SAMN05216583_12157 [Selenomonas ruminantium]
MKKFDPNVQGSYEQVKKAMACQSVEELLKLAKDEGYGRGGEVFRPAFRD